MYHTKFFKLLVAIQDIYYGVTGIWPLLHINSFMAVTGDKVDLWLVKMVGLLALSTGICLLYTRLRNRYPDVIIGLALTNAVSFGVVDVVYTSSDVISSIYFADAVVQALFLLGYTGVMVIGHRLTDHPVQISDGSDH